MPGGMPHKFPPPKNLKVLPKHLTGEQVRDVMHHWAGDLGVGCDTCHAEYADHRKGPNGRPELDFPSDDKPQKKIARLMYKMTELDKKDYVAKAADLDTKSSEAAPLTCGTCHRGSLQPKAYVPPKRDEHGPHPKARRLLALPLRKDIDLWWLNLWHSVLSAIELRKGRGARPQSRAQPLLATRRRAPRCSSPVWRAAGTTAPRPARD